MEYDFRWIRGEHVEVYLDGVFQFSADSIHEAKSELGLPVENNT